MLSLTRIIEKSIVLILLLCIIILSDTIATSANCEYEYPNDINTINITIPFHIPPLDLRGYEMNHFEVEQWFLNRINYHRVQYGLHAYMLYTPAIVISIEHSLDMRDNCFVAHSASDGRSHQQRHDRWMGVLRTRVTSSHVSSHMIDYGIFTQEYAMAIVDELLLNVWIHYFIMNPSYRYIGIGFSIQESGRGKLSITMASNEGERQAHWNRTTEERIAHRLSELERVRQEIGWIYSGADNQ